MDRGRRPAPAATSVLLALSLAGCARLGAAGPAVSPAVSPTGSPARARPAGVRPHRLAAARHYPGVGVVLDVPPAAARPAIGGEEAYRLTAESCDACTPDVALARLSRAQDGYRGLLVWAISVSHACLSPGTPDYSAGPGATAPPPPSGSCTYVTAVDARSGAVLARFTPA